MNEKGRHPVKGDGATGQTVKSRRATIRKQRAWLRRRPKTACRVYVLRAVEGGPIFYVGQTRLAPSERLRWHIKTADGSTPAKRWIASLGHAPILEVIDANATWDVTEAVWINRLRERGHPILNVLAIVPDKEV